MNVISWENGDVEITDYPECSDMFLASIVQVVNDRLADEDGHLSAEDSMKVLDLGHRTVGTSYHGLSVGQLKVVYVRCAALSAKKVVHLTGDPASYILLIAAVERWADNPTEENRVAAREIATRTPIKLTEPPAESSSIWAAYSAGLNQPVGYEGWRSFLGAIDTNPDPYYALGLAHEIIDLFIELTGADTEYKLPVPLEVAVEKMLVKS